MSRPGLSMWGKEGEPMTPQERAAIQSFYYRLHAGVEGGEFQERYEQEDIGRIIELLDETRRAALLECRDEINKLIGKDSGNWNRAIVYAADVANKLAQEGS